MAVEYRHVFFGPVWAVEAAATVTAMAAMVPYMEEKEEPLAADGTVHACAAQVYRLGEEWTRQSYGEPDSPLVAVHVDSAEQLAGLLALPDTGPHAVSRLVCVDELVPLDDAMLQACLVLQHSRCPTSFTVRVQHPRAVHLLHALGRPDEASTPERTQTLNKWVLRLHAAGVQRLLHLQAAPCGGEEELPLPRGAKKTRWSATSDTHGSY